MHFHLASRLSNSRVKIRNRKVSKTLENGQPEGCQDRIRLAKQEPEVGSGGNWNLEN